jgi:hypothetical protein
MKESRFKAMRETIEKVAREMYYDSRSYDDDASDYGCARAIVLGLDLPKARLHAVANIVRGVWSHEYRRSHRTNYSH